MVEGYRFSRTLNWSSLRSTPCDPTITRDRVIPFTQIVEERSTLSPYYVRSSFLS